MAKITIKELESLTANDAGRILREDGNLAGRISVRKDGVSVSFFYRYRWGDQNKEYACGTWPRKSLTDIRKARNQARALIDEQINPNEHKKTAKAQAHAATNAEAEQVKTVKVQTLTVQDLANAWLLDGVARKDGNAELRRGFNKDLFQALGRTAVNNVSEHDVRALIRTVVNRGAHRQAISFFADLTQMFNWSRKRQPWRALLVGGNPTELVDISPLIPADYEAERSRILSPAELLELRNRFQRMTADYDALPAGQKYDGIRPLKKETQLALWISLGTLCRFGELLQAEWKNVDLDQQTWFLPQRKRQSHPWQETRPPCLPLALRAAFLSGTQNLDGRLTMEHRRARYLARFLLIMTGKSRPAIASRMSKKVAAIQPLATSQKQALNASTKPGTIHLA